MGDLRFMNATELEGDGFGAIDDTERVEYSRSYSHVDYLFIFFVLKCIGRVILSIVATSANLFLAITICRFKRLKTRTNMYILNLSILNIFCFVSTPLYLFYIVIIVFWSNSTFLIMLAQLQVTVQILYLTFAFGLAVDWFVSSVRPNLIQKYHKFYKKVFLFIYLLSVIEWCAVFTYAEIIHALRPLFYVIFYAIILISLIILNIVRYCKKSDLPTDSSKTAYAFTIANIVIFSSLPLLLYHILLYVSYSSSYDFLTFIYCTEFIPEYISCGHPILVVYMLGKLNKHFGTAYAKSFKRSVKKYQTDNLDDASEDETKSGNNAV